MRQVFCVAFLGLAVLPIAVLAADMKVLVVYAGGTLASKPSVDQHIRDRINLNLGASFFASSKRVTLASSFPIVTFCNAGASPQSLMDCVEADLGSTRDSLLADVVFVVTDQDYFDSGLVCGEINEYWTVDPNYQPSVSNDHIAYAYINLGCFYNDREVATHEFGHLASLEHDVQAGDDLYLSTPDLKNHGYKLDSQDGSKRNIMAAGVGDHGIWFSTPTQNFPTTPPYPRGHPTQAKAASYFASTTWFIVEQYREPGPPPVKPAFLDIIPGYCYGDYDADWPTVSGAINYELQCDVNPLFTHSSTIYNGSGTFQHLNVGLNDTWWLRVRACNTGGCSDWRNGDQAAPYTQNCN